MEYPPGGDNKLYSKGLTVVLDSLAEIDYMDITNVKDETPIDMFESGKLEDEDTPLDELNQKRILLHNRNEIPSLFSTRRTPMTLSSDEVDYYTIAEVKISMKVH